VLLENAEVVEPAHLKLAGPARPQAQHSLGERVNAYLKHIPEGGIPYETLVEEVERALIEKASYATNWNQSRTAELLNLKRDKLRYRMKLYGMNREAAAEAHDAA
jgi:DNA-binding NtrC family response regulator